jgi:hypothetical protein
MIPGLVDEPGEDHLFPVRLLRVLYFLKNDLYDDWKRTGVPEPHEFVARYSSIRSYTRQEMQSLLKRITLDNHFYIPP